MEVTAASLNALRTGFRADYQRGFDGHESQFSEVASVVPSSTGSNTYGWLKDLPGMRRWVGDRVIHRVAEAGYTLVNEDLELTVAVGRNRIQDDELGMYAPLMAEMGRSAAAQPDLDVFGLMANGHALECYDGQNFFDTDHPVLDKDGNTVSVSNYAAGAEPAWYLLCTNRPIKPLIFQDRQKPQFVSLDNPDDPNVFMRKEFTYGVDGRWAAGFGFWQMAYKSQEALTAETYAAAYAAMEELQGDYGRPLGLQPNLLVVPGALREAANKILTAAEIDGSTNTWRNTAKPLVSPWLAAAA